MTKQEFTRHYLTCPAHNLKQTDVYIIRDEQGRTSILPQGCTEAFSADEWTDFCSRLVHRFKDWDASSEDCEIDTEPNFCILQDYNGHPITTRDERKL